MSNTARTDEIDKLVSSVRNFVAHQEPRPIRRRVKSELLILTPSLRVDCEDAQQTPVESGPEHALDVSNVLALEPYQQPERASLEATIAELEAAVRAQSDDWEPDEGETFEYAAWAASAFQVPVDDSVPAAVEPAETVDETPDIASQVIQEVASFVDVGGVVEDVLSTTDKQAALRAMVVEIIREELSGELGEKITRNVRKLVRREINRVLASRALD